VWVLCVRGDVNDGLCIPSDGDGRYRSAPGSARADAADTGEATPASAVVVDVVALGGQLCQPLAVRGWGPGREERAGWAGPLYPRFSPRFVTLSGRRRASGRLPR
jgi:hypothetical protein